jgi:hypothetical protein
VRFLRGARGRREESYTRPSLEPVRFTWHAIPTMHNALFF